MERGLILPILILAGIILILLVFLLLQKVLRHWQEKARFKRKQELLKKVEEYLLDLQAAQEDLPIPRSFYLTKKSGEDHLLEEILLEAIENLRGDLESKLTLTFEKLGYVDSCIRQLQRGKWWERAEAARKLGKMKSSMAVEPLIRALEYPHEDVRMAAARAIGEIGDLRGIKPLLETLREPDRWTAKRVADIILAMGEEVVPALLEALEGELGVGAKRTLIEILGKMRDLRAVETLTRFLHDPHPGIRAASAKALGEIGDDFPLEKIIELLQDSSWYTRAMAAKALGRFGNKRAISSLQAALTDRVRWVRVAAAQALQDLGDEGKVALIETVSGLLSRGDPAARNMVLKVIAELPALGEEKAPSFEEDGYGMEKLGD